MHIVINIDDKMYKAILDGWWPGMAISVKQLITRGIPLPKGHKRLIEDNFKVGPVFDKEGNRIGYQYVTQEDLDNALTIIEADDKENE